MIGAGLRRYFLSPPGKGPGYDRLPVLFRGRRRLRLALLVLLGSAQAGLTLAIALSVKQGFDSAGTASLVDAALLAGISTAALILAGVLRWREFVEAERLAQGYVHAVRVAIYRHALRLGVAGLEQTSRAALLLRFTGDLAPIRLWISRGLLRGLVGSLSVAMTLLALALLEPVLGAAVSLVVGATILVTVALGPRLEQRTRRVRSRRTAMLRQAQNTLSRLSAVEAHGGARQERRGLARLSRRLQRSTVSQSIVAGAMRAVGETGGSAAGLMAVLLGGLLVALGLTTAGGVVAALLIAGLLAPKVLDITRAFEYWTGARTSIEKQAALLALKPVGRPRRTRFEPQRLAAPEGRLELVDAGFRDLVRHVSLTVNPGQHVWLGTQLSAGSTYTVLKIAAGILHPTRGKVTLDGVDIRDLHRDDARKAIALASPRLDPLPGRLRESISYGVEPGRADLLDGILGILGMHGQSGVFSDLPAGLDYVVEENDERLGSGHKLLIGVLRARLAGARIVLIDQDDVSLDSPETEAIRTLLADWDAAVLWASVSNPMVKRQQDQLAGPTSP